MVAATPPGRTGAPRSPELSVGARRPGRRRPASTRPLDERQGRVSGLPGGRPATMAERPDACAGLPQPPRRGCYPVPSTTFASCVFERSPFPGVSCLKQFRLGRGRPCDVKPMKLLSMSSWSEFAGNESALDLGRSSGRSFSWTVIARTVETCARPMRDPCMTGAPSGRR